MGQRAPDTGGSGSDRAKGSCVWKHAQREGGGTLEDAGLFRTRSEISRDYPLNLSISLSGGKETNQDSPSNGE